MTSKKQAKKTTTRRSRKKVVKKREAKKVSKKITRPGRPKKGKTLKARAPATNGSNGHAGWTAERITELRNKMGLTQEQFSQKLGVTYVSVNRWENGKVLPKGLSLRALEHLEARA